MPLLLYIVTVEEKRKDTRLRYAYQDRKEKNRGKGKDLVLKSDRSTPLPKSQIFRSSTAHTQSPLFPVPVGLYLDRNPGVCIRSHASIICWHIVVEQDVWGIVSIGDKSRARTTISYPKRSLIKAQRYKRRDRWRDPYRKRTT